MRWFISNLRNQIPVVAYIIAVIAHGSSFDTGLSPEAACDLLVTAEAPVTRTGSWLRVRDMERSAVRNDLGAEVPPWASIKPASSAADRCKALSALRTRGYQLVAMVRWPSTSWKTGVRSDQPLRRLPIDLREAYERARRLATTYGDLIDYWEIENEPDISSVEENPETYAAFLKACYLGFKAGAMERGKAKEERAASQVLMAAFALPPGPYFNAWVANDGLRYTDGFNYHYYGYAEDFTGVYQQFEAAVTEAISPASAGESVFQTRFYPFRTDWQIEVAENFSADKAATVTNRALLRSRPLAVGEPALQEQGRWLVSAGTIVKETAEGWEFTVTSPAPGPLRPAMAELPLRDGWSSPAEASLAFEYCVRSDDGRQTADGGPQIAASREKASEAGRQKADDKSPASEVTPTPQSVIRGQSSGIHYPPSDISRPSSAASSRKLPVFLTEYGYGLLDKEARNTPAGREAQRAWFAMVQLQVKALRIEGPMAFLLRPYLEKDINEFGLLMESALGNLPSAVTAKASGPNSWVSAFAAHGYAMSPALAELLGAHASPAPQSWMIETPLPVSVVMDFIAGSGLQMNKSYRGYAMQTDSGEAKLIVYNFSTDPISGELNLKGSAWTLADGGRTIQLTLGPNERREIQVIVRPPTDHLVAQVATARFQVNSKALALDAADRPSPIVRPSPHEVSHPPTVSPSWTPGSVFEAYLRTDNGNLYQTWPRLQAREYWQWYFESFANFTPGFFGRSHLPNSLQQSKPTALVYFFRPEHYPTTYLIRRAQVVDYTALPSPK